MDKDKEAMALLQNKRQEFRCNQVVKAVSKEQSLRQRELSHESKHFKARLSKLIEKRKELKLDKAKTQELEMLLNPGLGNKIRAQSPARKLSPALISPGATERSQTFVFMTTPKHPVAKKLSVPARIPNEIETTARISAKVEKEPRQKATDTNVKVAKDIFEDDQNEKTVAERARPETNHHSVHLKVPDADSVHLKTPDAEARPRSVSEAQNDATEMKARALQRSTSDMNVKIVNVKQWLKDLEGDSAISERKELQAKFLKRFSISS
eukprot:Seg1518.4 transcript_id=Seg1518.4/GoldUCD/mRNA.D3Y31 product="hypothetical protein" protein_id=Seg1518.4/GoldUCD/D3Y31